MRSFHSRRQTVFPLFRCPLLSGCCGGPWPGKVSSPLRDNGFLGDCGASGHHDVGVDGSFAGKVCHWPFSGYGRASVLRGIDVEGLAIISKVIRSPACGWDSGTEEGKCYRDMRKKFLGVQGYVLTNVRQCV